MQMTIIFFMYKTFYFKFIFIYMKRICDLQITPISNTRMFILCIASLHIWYNECHGTTGLQTQTTSIYDV